MESTKKLFDKYAGMRKLGIDFACKELINYQPKDNIKLAAKKLGIFKGKTIMLNREGDLDILMDYCLFHYSHLENKKNAIERYLATNADSLSGDKMELALAIQKAEFAILSPLRATKHQGVIMVNLLSNMEEELLIDQGISSSAVPGMLIASTILRFPEFIMTTGAGFPLHNISDEVRPFIENYSEPVENFKSMTTRQQALFITRLIKLCFQNDGTAYIQYNELA